MRGAADQEFQRRTHRTDVCSDIDGVGEQQEGDDPVQQPGRVVLANIGGQAVAGHTADAGTDDLNADHERKGEERRPQDGVAEAGAHLGVGRDATRIVVGSAGDKPGPSLFQKDVDFLGVRFCFFTDPHSAQSVVRSRFGCNAPGFRLRLASAVLGANLRSSSRSPP